MNIKNLNAQVVRIILLAGAVLVLMATSAGFYFIFKQLQKFASETNTLTEQSESSTQRLNQLRDLRNYLDENQAAVQRAEDIVSSTEAYRYQNDFVNELSKLAVQSGVDITNFDFSQTPGASEDEGSTSATGSAAPAASVESISCTVSLESPLSYERLLKFLKLVEANPKRMQVTSVSISAPSSGETSDGEAGGTTAPNSHVAVEPLNIIVYLRQ